MASNGRDERRGTDRGQARLPDLRDYYRRKLSDLEPGLFDFRVLLVRVGAGGSEKIPVTDLLTSLDWADEGPVLSGTLTLRRNLHDPRSTPVGRGHRIRLQVWWRNGWYRLWDMRVSAPPTVDVGSGSVTVPLANDLDALSRNLREWEFRKTKQRKKGWKAHEVAKKVCRKEGVRIGRLARGKNWIEKLEGEMSGLAAIKKAYEEESEETGIRYVIRFRDGKLDVIPFERSDVLYEIRGIELGAAVNAVPKKERPRTVIIAKGRVEDEKVEIEVAPKRLVRRYGRVSMEKDYGRVKSRKKLREKAMRDLARELEVTRTAEIDIPGIPFLERASTLRWRTKEPGWHGPNRRSRDRQFCYATAARHSLTPTRYTTSLSVSQHDPFLADKRRREAEERDEKRKERNSG